MPCSKPRERLDPEIRQVAWPPSRRTWMSSAVARPPRCGRIGVCRRRTVLPKPMRCRVEDAFRAKLLSLPTCPADAIDGPAESPETPKQHAPAPEASSAFEQKPSTTSPSTRAYWHCQSRGGSATGSRQICRQAACLICGRRPAMPTTCASPKPCAGTQGQR